MTYIQTFSGQHFNLLDPQPEQILITDIARALSHICRFTGHLPAHYSVAQHSVLCSHLVPEEFALDALLHDAAEAYIGDCAAPLKALLPDYRLIEKRVEFAIADKFGMKYAGNGANAVKHADLVMLATERRDLLGHDGTNWPVLDGIEPARTIIIPWSSKWAMRRFLNRFVELGGSL